MRTPLLVEFNLFGNASARELAELPSIFNIIGSFVLSIALIVHRETDLKRNQFFKIAISLWMISCFSLPMLFVFILAVINLFDSGHSFFSYNQRDKINSWYLIVPLLDWLALVLTPLLILLEAEGDMTLFVTLVFSIPYLLNSFGVLFLCQWIVSDPFELDKGNTEKHGDDSVVS